MDESEYLHYTIESYGFETVLELLNEILKEFRMYHEDPSVLNTSTFHRRDDLIYFIIFALMLHWNLLLNIIVESLHKEANLNVTECYIRGNSCRVLFSC